MHEIYLAKSENHELRKRLWFEDNKLCDSVSPGKQFAFETHACRTLDDIYALLTELADDPSRSIVSGRPLVASGEKTADRFDDPKTVWWIIDLDGLPRIGSVTETIERHLPCLNGASYVYAYSQKANIVSDDLRVRVIAQVKPTTRAALRAYAEYYSDRIVAFEGLNKKDRPVDPRIYNRNHFIFTARPKLVGIEDPHPVRVFQVDGWCNVRLPELPELVEVTFEAGGSGISSLPFINRETGLPSLLNFGHDDADGHMRGEDASKALGRLKHFMGADAFDAGEGDNPERQRLWEKILEDSGATPTELRKYRDFAQKRWHYAREREDRNVMSVMAHLRDMPVTGLREATKRIRDAISSGMTKPEVTAVSATPGVGKSHIMLEEIKRIVDASEDPFNVDFYVPTNDLAKELWEKCEGMGISSFVEYGRSSKVHDNDSKGGGELACVKAVLNEQIGSVVENVSESLCDNGETQCPLIDTCRHMWQRRLTQHIPVRIRVHNFLSRQMPSEKNPDYRPVHLAVIDESSFVNTLTHTPPAIEIKELTAPRLESDDHAWVLKFAQVTNEGLTIERLRDAGFTPYVFDHLKRAELAQRPRFEITPDDGDEVWTDDMKKLAVVARQIDNFASVWRQLRDCLETGSMNRVRATKDSISLAWHTVIASIPQAEQPTEPKRDVNGDLVMTKDGRPQVQRVRRRICIPAVPTVILSGTMRRNIVEQFVEVDRWVECNVRLHGQTEVRQLTTLRGSKSECLYGSSDQRKKKGERKESRIKDASNLRKWLTGMAEVMPLISFKELKENGVPIARNYGAVAGLNDLEGRDLMIYGRPQPEAAVVELNARAIFCNDEEIPHVHNYPKRWIKLPEQEYAFQCDYHPDDRCEDVRWTICEGEMLQAIHRARPIRHAVTITVASNQVLGLPISEMIHRRERLHPEYKALMNTGILPGGEKVGQREMARLWPTICADGRTSERLWEEVNTTGWGLIRYRRGKTKWSEAKVRRMDEISALGDVEWEWLEPICDEFIIMDELAEADERERMLIVTTRGTEVRPHDRTYNTVNLFDMLDADELGVPAMLPMRKPQNPWAS